MQDHDALLHRRKAVAWVLTLTENTRLAPRPYEQHLLDRYAQGELSLDQIPALLATRVHHILYRSRATHVFSVPELTDLVTHSHPYNAYHHITGLLSYCDGRFVQLLEGPETAVLQLYATIRHDPRHEQIETLSDTAGPTRWFPDWRMALTAPPATDCHWLLSHLDAPAQTLAQPSLAITDPHLLTLMQAFRSL
jgi:hypothetical protein